MPKRALKGQIPPWLRGSHGRSCAVRWSVNEHQVPPWSNSHPASAVPPAVPVVVDVAVLLAAREECPSHTRWHLSCALVAQDLAEGFGHIARQLRHYSTPLPPLASPVPPGSTAVGFPTLVTCYCVPYRHCAPSR